MTDNCVFCDIIKTKKNRQQVLFEDRKVLVMLDSDHVTLGHTLVIWKKHAENFSELKTADFLHLAKVYYKTEKLLLKLLKLDRVVVLKSGGLVSHLHYHIYPLAKSTPWREVDLLFNKQSKRHFPAVDETKLVSEFRELTKSDT